jgi:hypothetical protein
MRLGGTHEILQVHEFYKDENQVADNDARGYDIK